MKNIQNLTIDINKKPFKAITANVGENGSRFVRITIVDNSVPVNLTGVTVYLYAKKTDGTKVFNSVTVEDSANGIVLAELTRQMLSVAGIVTLTLLLIKNDSNLASKQFLVNVDENIVDDGTINSTNEFTALVDALGRVNNIDSRFEKVDSQLEYKANKTHVWTMANMGQDVKKAMSGGSVAVVDDNAILDSNIVDLQISSSKLASSTILNTVDFETLNNVSGTTSIYIQPFKLRKGLISIKVKAEAGNTTFYLLTKISNNHFKIIDSLTLSLNEGINNIENLWIVEDDNMYLGFKSSNGVYYGTVSGKGFFEATHTPDEIRDLYTNDNTSLEYNLGVEIICSHSELINNTNNKINTLKDEVNYKLDLLFPIGGQQIQDMSFVESSDTQVNPTSIYIPNMPIKVNGRGEITVNSYGEFAVYIFEKTSSNTFKLKYKQVFNSIGMNTHSIDYDLREGDYIGLHGEIKYFKDGNVGGFYECEKKNISDITDIGGTLTFDAINTTISGAGYKFAFGFVLNIPIRYIDPDVIDVSKIDFSKANLSGVDISNADWSNVDESKIELSKIKLTDFNLLRYSEIDDQVGFIGRWFDATVDGEKCKCTINAGSEFYFKVKGATTVDVNFKMNSVKATPFFAYSIDGGEFTRQLITSPTLPTISTDEHIIRIVIDGLTETEDKWMGEKGIAFKDITTNGGTIKGIIPRNKKIMFFGDSITEGIRALNMNADSNGNSSIKAYPFECCKNLNAVTYRVGFGATSITNPYGSGGIPNCLKYIDNMTNSRETPYYEPDIIVINHGTNDGNNGSDVFIPAYNKVLDRLTLKYPGIPIFTVIPFNQSHASDIRNCISNRNNCYLVETDGWGVTYTDGLHPDANGAQIAGEKLANEIINVLGKSYFI